MADLGKTQNVSGNNTNLANNIGYQEKTFSNISSNFAKEQILDTEILENDDYINNSQTSLIQGTQNYFLMRGKDVDCITTTYKFWTVTGAPDTDASEYVGAKCGASALQDIIVVFKYTQ